MPDDARYARKIALRYGIDLHEIQIDSDIAGLLPKLVAILDEPIGDPAAINTFLMCQAARDAGAKVILSGMGADELFGGYRKHLACLMAERYRKLPNVARRAAERDRELSPRCCRRSGTSLPEMGQALPYLCRSPRGGGFSP